MAMIDNKQDKLTAGVDYATPAALNTKQNKISTSGLLKCDGNGNITPAVPGVDYMTPSSATPSSAAKVCYDRKDYYVNAVSGNDNNDGLSTATAWKTVTKVNSVINEYDIYQKQVFFNFAAGNYPEVLEIRSKVGEIRIQCTSGTNTVFGNISVSYSGMVCFYYITADMISVTHSQYADIFYCTVEKSLTVVASKARVEGVTVRNTSNGIHAMNSSVVYASNNKGTGNGSGLTAYASIILKTGTQPSGTVAETKTYGGQIFS